MLDRQPTLTGPTLQARPLRPGDAAALAAVAADPLIWSQHPASDRWRPEVFARFFADGLASGGALLVSTRAGEVIGSSRYDAYDPDRARVEIGWTFLARAHWGGAANDELKRLMLDHAFGAVETVVFRVGTDNRRSRRAVEKLGAVLAADLPDDPLGPHVAYELRREAWLARPR